MSEKTFNDSSSHLFALKYDIYVPNCSMVICTYSVHITMANFSTMFTSKTFSGIAPLAHVMSEKTFSDN